MPPSTSATQRSLATASTTTTTTAESTPPQPHQRAFIPSGTLRLRGASAQRRGIRWAEDVIDNEGLGRKKSKVCCIYHKTREVGESSSEDDSDSSSSSDGGSASDSGLDTSKARIGGKGSKGRRHRRSHDHEDGEGHRACGADGEGGGKGKKTSPNAYEKMPKHGATQVVK